MSGVGEAIAVLALGFAAVSAVDAGMHMYEMKQKPPSWRQKMFARKRKSEVFPGRNMWRARKKESAWSRLVGKT
jgi:hypothetical protein